MTASQLRQRRITLGISGSLLCARAGGFDRGRLSLIERGHVQATDSELRRLAGALDSLDEARQAVLVTAKEVGWPEDRI